MRGSENSEGMQGHLRAKRHNDLKYASHSEVEQ